MNSNQVKVCKRDICVSATGKSADVLAPIVGLLLLALVISIVAKVAS